MQVKQTVFDRTWAFGPGTGIMKESVLCGYEAGDKQDGKAKGIQGHTCTVL